MSNSAQAPWYYVVGAERKGPFTRDQIDALIQAGAVGRATLVWSQGMATWQPLGETPLATLGSQGQPVPPPLPARPAVAAAPGAEVNDLSAAITACFGRYATFSGRANRAEFWYFQLFLLLTGIVTAIIDVIAFGANGGALVNPLFSLAVILPNLAVGARRLHDTGRTGWWWLIVLVPVIGAIVLIVFWCQRGTAGRNRFG